MEQDRDPQELRELLGAYALGALDDDEHARVEDYVLHDTDARSELHQLEHAVAWLGHASPRPSEASWQAVRAEMDRDLAERTGADGPGDTAPAPVVDLAARRTRPRWARLTAVAAALALVVAVGIGTISVLSSGDGSSPTTTVALAAPDGQVAVRVRLHDDGTGTIVTSSLPAAPSGHEYQLWSQADATASMRSAGLLGATTEGDHFRIPEHSHRMAISVEPAGGSHQPTTPPVAVSASL
jgi:anti-sigma-K factor RskA